MLRPTAIVPGARSVALVLAVLFGFADAATATLWHDGEMLTYTQAEWGDIPDGSNGGTVLANNFMTIYPSGVLAIGDTAGFLMFFQSAMSLKNYLPASGLAGPLDTDLIDPTMSSSGTFGGNVTAIQLNVDFSDADVVHGTAPIRFGDLLIYDVPATPDLDHVTVRQAVSRLQSAVSGLPTSDSYDALDALSVQLAGSFFAGSPSAFAQDHLAAPVPEPAPILLLGLGLVAIGAAARSKR